MHLHDLRSDVELGEELLLHVAERADRLLGEHEGGEHVLFGNLVSAGLEHVDRVLGTGDDEIEVGVLSLVKGRVDEKLTGVGVATDAHAGKRALERQPGGHQGCRGAHDRDDVRLVDLVGGEDGGDNLNLVAEPVGERRADRTVNHPSSKGGLLTRARLTLDETARKLAGGIHPLLEVDRQREEVQVLRELRRGGGHEDDGLALTHKNGSTGLLGQLAGLEGVLLAEQFERLYYLSHRSLFFPLLQPGAPCASASSPRRVRVRAARFLLLPA